MSFGRAYKPKLNKEKFGISIKLPNSLKGRINLALVLLCVAIFICWGAFFNYTFRSISTSSEQLTMQVSNGIVKTLENTFLNLIHSALALSESAAIEQLVTEEDPIEFHKKISRAISVLDSSYQSDGLVDDVLVYTTSGVFARLRGDIGNTTAKRIGIIVDESKMYGHIAVTVEGVSYIGYVREIKKKERIVGYVVFLINGYRLESQFSEYNADDSLSISLIANESVVASSRQALNEMPVDDILTQYDSYTYTSLGVTPFSLLVLDDGLGFNALIQAFSIAAVATILLVIVLQILFFRFIGRYFLNPMLKIMESAGKENSLLELTGQEEFDKLVEQINMMIIRLEDNQKMLYEMHYNIQDAEIDRQRAIIISLKKQINAHFTVNTINVIKRLAEMGKTTHVGEICDNLSNLLRYANNSEELISGFDEMFVLEEYIKIMQTRYPGSFVAEFIVDDELDCVYLPRMLLQPLVENSVMHGVSNVEKGHIIVSGKLQDPNVVFRICDNGVGIPKDKLEKLNSSLANADLLEFDEGLSGIALLNIQKRIKTIYGKEYGMEIESTQGVGTDITVTIPAYKEQFLYDYR